MHELRIHRDQHQWRNADRLVQAGGAVVVRDWKDPVRTQAGISPLLTALLTRAERRARMADALRALGPADGADTVAQAIFKG